MTNLTAHQVEDIDAELARRLHQNHMEQLGIAATMRLAFEYNRKRFAEQDEWRRAMYRDRLSELLEENGPQTRPVLEMHDGWALDASMSLPHLERMLEDAERIITERAGKRLTPKGTYRSFFQEMWDTEDCEKYPSFLDFATSSDLLSTVAHYLQCIPALSTTLPSGIRLIESNAAFDDQPDEPHDSQLWHIDYYSLPNVYVLVALEEITHEHGPWTFIPRNRSQQIKEQLGYWETRKGYRVGDEDFYSVANPNEVIEFTCPRGTVLFIESSGCFHFGSRNSVKPRFQLMLGYTGVVRTDFSELIMSAKTYPVRESDSRLRKMVLTKDMLPDD
jgi:hypothetical protein